MGIFDRFRRKPEIVEKQPINNTTSNETIHIEEEITIPDSDEILEISTNEVLDTNSQEAIAKYKHNLRTLYKRLNETGQIDKLVILREDDYYPYDDNWIVASKQTMVENVNFALSTRLRERIALKKTNLYRKIGNITVPPDEKEREDALKKVDKNIASISLPAHFRSTKHFTINTALGTTGEYNGVSTDRNFTIIDDIDNLINSEYTYSIAPKDAYLDITHEPLKISSQSIVLINIDKYEILKQNQELMNQLKNKKVIIFKGDETLAINMVLTQIGVIPTRVGTKYFEDTSGYASKKTEEKLKQIAEEKGLLYDQSHAGEKYGHFSNAFDEKNNDWNYSISELVTFLQQKFPNVAINSSSITKIEAIDNLIDTVGEEQLLEAIHEYNKTVQENTRITRKKFIEERTNLPHDISEMFKKTIKRISKFYKDNEKVNYTIDELRTLEENIRLFFQAPSIEEQLQNASIILKTMQKQNKNELNQMFEETLPETIEERNYKI